MFILVSVVRDVFMQIVGSRVRWYSQWIRGLMRSGSTFMQTVGSGVCSYSQ